MNTLQNVYDRLADKTELAKHEVELTALDDLKKLASISAKQLQTNKNFTQVLIAIIDGANKKLAEAEKNYNDNLSLQKNSEIIFNNFKKSAQDLGIDYKNTEGFKLHEEILKNAVQMENKKQFIDAIKILIK